jgi:hypothetical protein
MDECADYLLNYAPFLQYDKALAEGVPIATGVIEGTCRYLVEDRMNITGARWSLAGAEAVLRLRALRASDDFDAYWEFHEHQEYERNHTSHYADHRVPEIVSPAASSQPSRRVTLKIVKNKARRSARTNEAAPIRTIRKSKRAAPIREGVTNDKHDSGVNDPPPQG